MLLATATRAVRRSLVLTRSFLRCRSLFAIDPAVRPVAASLACTQPAFVVSTKQIQVLNNPPEFYALLLDMIRRAKCRIFLSTLYIGSAESELIAALHHALLSRPSLQLYLQLDFNRSTRPGPSSTAKILLPLIQAFPSRVHVSLFRSPHLRGVLAKVVPPRFNEGWGTWHAKIYGADDQVMISGANLNKSYFTNRQDRYFHFSDQPHLAQYCFDFLQTVSTVSYRLIPAEPATCSQNPPCLSSPHTSHRDGYVLHWPHPDLHPHRIHHKTQNALSAFQASKKALHDLEFVFSASDGQGNNNATSNLTSSGTSDQQGSVLLFPIIQAGQFNVREEESALSLLFRHLGRLSLLTSSDSPNMKRPLVDLTSGYFGLYRTYQNLVIGNNVDTRIVVASPKANGFYGSKGLSGRIPEGYTFLEQRFMHAVRAARRLWDPKLEQGAMLSEWEREGWTYHAKGLWVSPTHSSPPVLTLFGSTNLNARSAHIDTELSFVMVVPTASSSHDNAEPTGGGKEVNEDPNLSLRSKLADEINRIRMHAHEWKGEERNVRFWTKVMVRLVKGML